MFRKFAASPLAAVALVLVASYVCQAQPQSLMTRHVREAALSAQAPVGRLPSGQVMRLVLVLPLRHQPELENFLQELYDPSSPSYRQFLTVEEFTARFGPSQEDYDAVIHFAKANGFTVVGTSRNRHERGCHGPVANIEKALHVTMGVYQHPTENRTFFAPDREPTVDLPFQLWHIAGLDNYSIPRPLVVRRNTVGGEVQRHDRLRPSASFLGSDMRAAYYGGSAYRQRPVARAVGVLRHRSGRPEHLLTATSAKPTMSRSRCLSTDGTSTVASIRAATTPSRPWT